MALETYNDLVLALAAYVTYDDPSEYLDVAICQAEAVMNREIRIREIQSSLQYNNQTAAELSLPSDHTETIALYETGEDGGELERLPPRNFWSMQDARSGTGQPHSYTTIGTTLYLAPQPDAGRNYVLLYYKRVTALSPSNDTNEIYALHPDVYVQACLAQIYDLVGDEMSYAKHQAAYERIRKEITQSDARARYRPGMRQRSQSVSRDGAWRIA